MTNKQVLTHWFAALIGIGVGATAAVVWPTVSNETNDPFVILATIITGSFTIIYTIVGIVAAVQCAGDNEHKPFG